MNATTKVVLLTMIAMAATGARAQETDPQPFGTEFPKLDPDATGEWWKPTTIERGPNNGRPH